MRHVVARMLWFHNPSHQCIGGDASTLVSADPQAKPLNRNVVALGLAAHSFYKKKQIFHMHSSYSILHLHCELCFHFTY